MRKFLALSLLLLGVCAARAGAQTLLENGKIPDDLLITLKRQGGWGGNYEETTIDARGEFSFVSRPTILIASRPFSSPKSPTEVFVAGRRIKNPKYLKPKLTEEKLRRLIGEFERIEFFRFGEDFPVENSKDRLSLTDQQTEIIAIRINGRTKEVFNYLGDSLNRTRILRELAERVRGAAVWNFENEAIPEVLEIDYRETDGGKINRHLQIDARGKIIENLYASKFEPAIGKELPILLKSRTVGKISKPQLRQLLDEFENDVFSTFRYSILTKYSGCRNEAGANETKRTHIHLQINRVQQIYASLYKDCDALPGTDAARFERMTAVLTKLFKDFSIIK